MQFHFEMSKDFKMILSNLQTKIVNIGYVANVHFYLCANCADN